MEFVEDRGCKCLVITPCLIAYAGLRRRCLNPSVVPGFRTLK
jgi:hypothetical protein